jgi:hypothetical protein
LFLCPAPDESRYVVHNAAGIVTVFRRHVNGSRDADRPPDVLQRRIPADERRS